MRYLFVKNRAKAGGKKASRIENHLIWEIGPAYTMLFIGTITVHHFPRSTLPVPTPNFQRAPYPIFFSQITESKLKANLKAGAVISFVFARKSPKKKTNSNWHRDLFYI